jgi:hypothetical protein
VLSAGLVAWLVRHRAMSVCSSYQSKHSSVSVHNRMIRRPSALPRLRGDGSCGVSLLLLPGEPGCDPAARRGRCGRTNWLMSGLIAYLCRAMPRLRATSCGTKSALRIPNGSTSSTSDARGRRHCARESPEASSGHDRGRVGALRRSLMTDGPSNSRIDCQAERAGRRPRIERRVHSLQRPLMSKMSKKAHIAASARTN